MGGHIWLAVAAGGAVGASGCLYDMISVSYDKTPSGLELGRTLRPLREFT